ncbi:unnamed protein product [Paramecium pentaurelia]|uniref:Uncharacterized protein n=1 Tax=Paramecium pentaurelia TaxID=43138 RepID=A0A8S1WWA3_9CILI|nr:unnamed protein product [Paramecium pentaurelia]
MQNFNKYVAFTKCTYLKGFSTFNDIAQSIEQQYIQNGTFQSTQSLHSCDKYKSQECTFGLLGIRWSFFWNSKINLCSVISSCDDVTNQLVCSSLTHAYQQSYFFKSCIEFQFQGHNYKDQCTISWLILMAHKQNYVCGKIIDVCHMQRFKQCLKSLLINIIAIKIFNIL